MLALGNGDLVILKNCVKQFWLAIELTTNSPVDWQIINKCDRVSREVIHMTASFFVYVNQKVIKKERCAILCKRAKFNAFRYKA